MESASFEDQFQRFIEESTQTFSFNVQELYAGNFDPDLFIINTLGGEPESNNPQQLLALADDLSSFIEHSKLHMIDFLNKQYESFTLMSTSIEQIERKIRPIRKALLPLVQHATKIYTRVTKLLKEPKALLDQRLELSSALARQSLSLLSYDIADTLQLHGEPHGQSDTNNTPRPPFLLPTHLTNMIQAIREYVTVNQLERLLAYTGVTYDRLHHHISSIYQQCFLPYINAVNKTRVKSSDDIFHQYAYLLISQYHMALHLYNIHRSLQSRVSGSVPHGAPHIPGTSMSATTTAMEDHNHQDMSSWQTYFITLVLCLEMHVIFILTDGGAGDSSAASPAPPSTPSPSTGSSPSNPSSSLVLTIINLLKRSPLLTTELIALPFIYIAMEIIHQHILPSVELYTEHISHQIQQQQPQKKHTVGLSRRQLQLFAWVLPPQQLLHIIRSDPTHIDKFLLEAYYHMISQNIHRINTNTSGNDHTTSINQITTASSSSSPSSVPSSLTSHTSFLTTEFHFHDTSLDQPLSDLMSHTVDLCYEWRRSPTAPCDPIAAGRHSPWSHSSTTPTDSSTPFGIRAVLESVSRTLQTAQCLLTGVLPLVPQIEEPDNSDRNDNGQPRPDKHHQNANADADVAPDSSYLMPTTTPRACYTLLCHTVIASIAQHIIIEDIDTTDARWHQASETTATAPSHTTVSPTSRQALLNQVLNQIPAGSGQNRSSKQPPPSQSPLRPAPTKRLRPRSAIEWSIVQSALGRLSHQLTTTSQCLIPRSQSSTTGGEEDYLHHHHDYYNTQQNSYAYIWSSTVSKALQTIQPSPDESDVPHGNMTPFRGLLSLLTLSTQQITTQFTDNIDKMIKYCWYYAKKHDTPYDFIVRLSHPPSTPSSLSSLDRDKASSRATAPLSTHERVRLSKSEHAADGTTGKGAVTGSINPASTPSKQKQRIQTPLFGLPVAIMNLFLEQKSILSLISSLGMAPWVLPYTPIQPHDDHNSYHHHRGDSIPHSASSRMLPPSHLTTGTRTSQKILSKEDSLHGAPFTPSLVYTLSYSFYTQFLNITAGLIPSVEPVLRQLFHPPTDLPTMMFAPPPSSQPFKLPHHILLSAFHRYSAPVTYYFNQLQSGKGFVDSLSKQSATDKTQQSRSLSFLAPLTLFYISLMANQSANMIAKITTTHLPLIPSPEGQHRHDQEQSPRVYGHHGVHTTLEYLHRVESTSVLMSMTSINSLALFLVQYQSSIATSARRPSQLERVKYTSSLISFFIQLIRLPTIGSIFPSLPVVQDKTTPDAILAVIDEVQRRFIDSIPPTTTTITTINDETRPHTNLQPSALFGAYRSQWTNDLIQLFTPFPIYQHHNTSSITGYLALPPFWTLIPSSVVNGNGHSYHPYYQPKQPTEDVSLPIHGVEHSRMIQCPISVAFLLAIIYFSLPPPAAASESAVYQTTLVHSPDTMSFKNILIEMIDISTIYLMILLYNITTSLSSSTLSASTSHRDDLVNDLQELIHALIHQRVTISPIN